MRRILRWSTAFLTGSVVGWFCMRSSWSSPEKPQSVVVLNYLCRLRDFGGAVDAFVSLRLGQAANQREALQPLADALGAWNIAYQELEQARTGVLLDLQRATPPQQEAFCQFTGSRPNNTSYARAPTS